MRRFVNLILVLSFLVILTLPLFAKEDVITVLVPFRPDQPFGAYFGEVIKLFERTHPGVKVKWIFGGSWGDYIKKLGTMLGSRQGPDVAWGNADYIFIPGRGGGPASADSLTIPDEYFTKEERLGMGAAVMGSIQVPGRGIIVWPWHLYIGGISTMIANEDYLRSAGFDPDEIRAKGWTTDDFLKALSKIVKDVDGDGKNDIWGFYPVNADDERIGLFPVYLSKKRPLEEQWAVDYFFDIKTGELKDPELLLKAFQWLHDLVHKYKYAPKEAVTKSYGDAQDAFLRGEIAFIAAGPDFLARVKEHNRLVLEGKIKGKVIHAGIVPMPYLNEPGHEPIRPTLNVYGFYNFKQHPYKGDEHTKHVMEFCDFITNITFQPVLAAYGFMTPDRRIFATRYAMAANLYDTDDPSVRYWLNDMRNRALPKMGQYAYVVFTEEFRKAKINWWRDTYRSAVQGVITGKLTPEEAYKKLVESADKLPRPRVNKDKLKEVLKIIKELEKMIEEEKKIFK